MSIQILINGTVDSLTTGTRYLAVTGCCNWTVDRGTWPRTMFSSAGTLSHLYVQMAVASGVGSTRTFTVYKNNIATGITVSIAGAADTEAQDTAHSIAVAAGDYLQLRHSDAGNVPAASRTRFALKWTPTTAGNTQMSGVVETTNMNRGCFPSFAGSQQATPATTTASQLPFPCGGSLKNLYVKLSAAPGFGKTRTLKIYLNGVATGLSVAIANFATTGNDAGPAVAVAAGDLVDLRGFGTIGISAHKAAFGVTFVPDDVDDFVFGNSSGDFMPTLGDGIYRRQVCSGEGVDGVSKQLIGWYTRIKRFQVQTTAPTAGFWEFQLIDSVFGSDVYEVIVDAASDGSEYQIGDFAWVDGRNINLNIIQQNVPAAPPDDHIHATMTVLATVLKPDPAIFFGCNT